MSAELQGLFERQLTKQPLFGHFEMFLIIYRLNFV